jgi:hypothetical protein
LSMEVLRLMIGKIQMSSIASLRKPNGDPLGPGKLTWGHLAQSGFRRSCVWPVL